MSRNIFTNKAVGGGIAAAIIGLGLAIGGHHTPAQAAPAAPFAPAAQVVQAAPAAQAAQPAAAAPAKQDPKQEPKQDPKPVAGLDQTQMSNAKKIVETAKAMGLPERAQIIAVATAMQESNLHNLASTRIAESYQYTDEGEGSDYDSVGLFQQRPNWGDTKDLMNPQASTKKFLEALKEVPDWDKLPLSAAAQEVQVSAYPDAYAKHESKATQIVHEINK